MVERPVDRLMPKPSGFLLSRQDAAVLGCCARCGFDIDFGSITPQEANEWRISSLCPNCATELFDLWGDLE